jgi:hypothetical protein
MGFLLGSENTDFKRGTIITKVVCKHDSNQSYALFLPAEYSENKKWPIIYAFDPGARGTVPLKLFKEAAQDYGYIVVCSYNSQNGPNEPIIEAMKAIWRDTQARFSINNQRIYATGFSGGARISSFFSLIVNNPVQGIIACGAGLYSSVKPEQLKSTHYYGIAGVGDFNYSEMKKLEKTLAEKGKSHRMVYFDGIHSWPKKELCTQAVEWMEIQAMKSGLKETNQKWINDIFQKEMARAGEMEAKGLLLFAAQEYRSIMANFEDYKDITDIQEKIQKLTVSKKFQKLSKKDEKHLETEQKTIQHFIGIFAYIAKKNVSTEESKKIITALKIKNIQKKAQGKKDIYESGLYTRLLAILNQKARRHSDASLKKGDYTRSIIFCEIAVKTSKNSVWHRYDLYRLACSYATANQTKPALIYLQQAVDAGFLFPDYIKKDKYMNPIKKMPAFKKIIKKIYQKQAEKEKKN